MKKKLVYIAGMGFSGSTFLDMLLGSHAELIGLGEMMYLQDYWLNKKRCTCGEGIHDCSLWGSALPDRTAPEGQYYTPEFHHDTYYSQLDATNLRKSQNADFARHQFGLLRKIAEKSGKQIFVDSSKNLERLQLYFENCPEDFEIVAIHLFRDPLSVSNSFREKYQTHGTLDYLRNHLAWTQLGMMLFKYLKENRIPHLTLSYRDICLNTLDSANSILRLLGVETWEKLPELTPRDKHNIEGNPTRFSMNRVYYSQKWKTELPLKGKVLGAPFLIPYLYFNLKRRQARIDA